MHKVLNLEVLLVWVLEPDKGSGKGSIEAIAGEPMVATERVTHKH
jgi:hypothetical protein